MGHAPGRSQRRGSPLHLHHSCRVGVKPGFQSPVVRPPVPCGLETHVLHRANIRTASCLDLYYSVQKIPLPSGPSVRPITELSRALAHMSQSQPLRRRPGWQTMHRQSRICGLDAWQSRLRSAHRHRQRAYSASGRQTGPGTAGYRHSGRFAAIGILSRWE